jgi:hypothetical protein
MRHRFSAKMSLLTSPRKQYCGTYGAQRLPYHIHQGMRSHRTDYRGHVQQFHAYCSHRQTATMRCRSAARLWADVAQRLQVTLGGVLIWSLLCIFSSCQACILEAEAAPAAAQHDVKRVRLPHPDIAQLGKDWPRVLSISDIACPFSSQELDAPDPVDPFTLYGTV